MLNKSRRWRSIGIAIAGGFAGLLATSAGADTNVPEWVMGGYDLSNTRHQVDEKRISPKNVEKLGVEWVTLLGGSISATPAVDDFIYAVDWKTPGISDNGGNLYKIDRDTGVIVWQRAIAEYTGIVGDFARVTPFAMGDKLILGNQAGRIFAAGETRRAQIFAVDKVSGDLIWRTIVDDHPGAIITASPVVHEGVVYSGVSSYEEGIEAFTPGYVCCTFRGSVVALDAETGALKWKTYTVPAEEGYSGGASWGSSPVVDKKRGLVYATTGNNYSLPAAVSECIADAVQAGLDDDQIRNCDPHVTGDDGGDNWFDAVVALDLETGEIVWGKRFLPYDEWTVSCIIPDLNPQNCPEEAGPDYDFAQGPTIFDGDEDNGEQDVLGLGQKSGDYWGLNPDTGALLWGTKVGPGGISGGLQWGSASDGQRIYVAVANFPTYAEWTLGDGTVINSGFWAALSIQTGEILWETAGPNFDGLIGAMSVANGVVYAGSQGPGFIPSPAGATMFALNAETGAILWTFATEGSVVGAPAIVDGQVIWGSGYESTGGTFGEVPDNKLYSFGILRGN